MVPAPISGDAVSVVLAPDTKWLWSDFPSINH